MSRPRGAFVTLLLVVVLTAAGFVYAQAPAKESFAHDQYVTHRELADKEVAALKETQGLIIGLIISLVACGVAFGGNSMAIRSFGADLRRHSGVHVTIKDEVKAELETISGRLSRLEDAVGDLPRMTAMKSTGEAIHELKALLEANMGTDHRAE